MADEIIDDWEQHEGDTDMPPEVVAYNKGWDEGSKQARAEVLVACQGVVEVFIQEIGRCSDEFGKYRPFKKWNREDWEAAGLRLLTDVQDALEKVQPAASALEALLREAELRGRWAQHARERHGDGEGREFFCDECKHLTELEKARANKGKG